MNKMRRGINKLRKEVGAEKETIKQWKDKYDTLECKCELSNWLGGKINEQQKMKLKH